MNPPLRIIVPEFGFSAGSESVLLEVLPRWCAAGHEVHLVAPGFRLQRYRVRGIDSAVQLVEMSWPGQDWRRLPRLIARLFGPKAARRFWIFRFRRLARQVRATHVFVPWIVGVPTVSLGLPVGVMIMDLAWRHYPDGWFDQPSAMLDRAVQSWLAHAHYAFPVSNSTAAELAATFPELASRLCTVPHGGSVRETTTVGADASPFFLTPASLTPNKNHIVLLRAALMLWQEGHEFRLVWTGSDTAALASPTAASSAVGREVQELVRASASVIRDRLECRGFVTEDELARLFSSAHAVVLPSSYEGYGLPVTEAYEHGAPVIATDIPPFREQRDRYTMADRTSLVPPGSVSALADALRAALTTPPAALPLETLRQRLASWTWDHAAESYLDFFTSRHTPDTGTLKKLP